MQRLQHNQTVLVVEKESNSLGTAAFVLSLVSIFSLGLLAPLSLLLSIVAVQKKPRDLAVAGLVLSLVMCVPPLLLLYLGGATTALVAFSGKNETNSEKIAKKPAGDLVCSEVRQLRGQVEMIGKNGTDKPVSKLSLEIVVTDKNGEVVAKDVVSARIPDAIQPGESRRLYFAPQYDSQLKAIWPDTATATAKVLTTE